MAKRTVIWTRTADIQFVGVLKYWTERNKSTSYAKKLISIVSKHTNQLLKAPLSYKQTDFKDIRVASIKNFSLYYKITEEHIIVTAFWDNRQDPKKLLSILKKG